MGTVGGVIYNSGTVNVSAMGTNTATFDVIRITNNNGKINIGPGGIIPSSLSTLNQGFGQITVTTGSANLGYINNANANGLIAVTQGGSVVAAPITTMHAVDNQGTIRVDKGGAFTAIYNPAAAGDGVAVNNAGNLIVNDNASLAQIQNGDLANANTGTISLGGGSIRFNSSDLLNAGTINGNGTLRFTIDSTFSEQAAVGGLAQFNTNGVNAIFDGDTGLMEAPTQDTGGGIANIGRLLDPSALRDFSIINNSSVTMTDAFLNSNAQPEAVYTQFFGIDAGSTLTLNGINVYYAFLDPNEGGLSGKIITTNGGALIQLPEPGALSMLAIAVVGTMRRGRRTVAP